MNGYLSTMSEARAPRSTPYDGLIYGRIVEPFLAGVHSFVSTHLPAGPRVVDACCGTGGLSRRMAAEGRRVVGVDLSPRNVAFAEEKARAAGLSEDRLSYQLADVSTLAIPEEGPYDIATIVLALHEMPTAGRPRVLDALKKVARQLMVVDYAVPMPWNLAGVRNRAAEVAAGREHFGGFRDYNRRGGLLPLLRDADLRISSRRQIDAGTLEVVVAEPAPVA